MSTVDVSVNGQEVDGDPDWTRKRVTAKKGAVKDVPRGPYSEILITRLNVKNPGFCVTYDQV